jgi:uncharacterized RDD family membrane protein YckC
LRQSAQISDTALSWKQEVNRRVAEHNERKTPATGQLPGPEAQHPAGNRAAEAAARVAARYAKAPSYSQMLAEEARSAIRAAEAVTRAARDAQAAAESMLASLESASAASEQEWEQEFFSAAPQEPVRTQAAEPSRPLAQPSAPISSQNSRQITPGQVASGRPSYEIRWDGDLPARETASARATHTNTIFESPAAGMEGIEVVEPALPIHANLIQFPRELVAQRKARPRRDESQYASATGEYAQLSIFEVDPLSVSPGTAAAVASADVTTAQWVGPEWSGIRLDEEPQADFDAVFPTEEKEVPAVPALQLAPMNRRLLASLVDFSLIIAIFLGCATYELSNLIALPPLRMLEMGSMAGLALTAALYMTLFFTLGKATPGMKYAHLELRTFSGERPGVLQRWGRIAAGVVSLLPLGLGAAISIFDEQHLCWHDRLSGTYPRKG